jgi:hypothetical protein
MKNIRRKNKICKRRSPKGQGLIDMVPCNISRSSRRVRALPASQSSNVCTLSYIHKIKRQIIQPRESEGFGSDRGREAEVQ